MSEKKKNRGLGRGLSALMADVAQDTSATDTPPRSSDQTVPIERIRPNPNQPRQRFAKDALDELAASIKEKGIIQPLVVRAVDDGYEIVAGERRWRAAQQAQQHEVPVLIRNFTDTEVLEVAIIENIQRADLNAMEEAMGYTQLMDRFGHTQEKLAEAMGKSRSHIANLMRLLQLPVEVQDLVRDDRLTAGHARALITAQDPVALAKLVVDRGLSVRETEKLAKSEGDPKTTQTMRQPRVDKDADTKALEADLSAALGMKVLIDHKPGQESGAMTIRYENLEGLDSLCRVLSSN